DVDPVIFSSHGVPPLDWITSRIRFFCKKGLRTRLGVSGDHHGCRTRHERHRPRPRAAGCCGPPPGEDFLRATPAEPALRQKNLTVMAITRNLARCVDQLTLAVDMLRADRGMHATQSYPPAKHSGFPCALDQLRARSGSFIFTGDCPTV